MKPKIGIVTVTFNPNLNDFKRNINTYLYQVDEIVVIDNSTIHSIVLSLSDYCNNFPSIKLIQLNSNMGIAYAQNIGINYFFDNKFDYVIEIDQDSKLSNEYVNQIISNFVKIKTEIDRNIIALGCIAINEYDGSVYDGFKKNIGFKKVTHTLSSGLLIELLNFKKVGYKDERLFIDLVDWDWCWKAMSKGYSTYIDTSLSIIHSMGERHVSVLNFKIGIPKPYRHYYAFRNSIYLLFKSHPPLNWKLKVIPLLFFKLLLYPLFMDNGKLRFKNMIFGLKDFFYSKMGCINE